MRTLALDPTTGDLALARGLVVADGADAVRTKLVCRLGLWRGEYLPDTSVGVPWSQILGGRSALFATTTLRAAVSTCPGVEGLLAFTSALDPRTRGLSVSFVAKTASGPVAITDFRVEG